MTAETKAPPARDVFTYRNAVEFRFNVWSRSDLHCRAGRRVYLLDLVACDPPGYGVAAESVGVRGVVSATVGYGRGAVVSRCTEVYRGRPKG